jgi:hypothetical protein
VPDFNSDSIKGVVTGVLPVYFELHAERIVPNCITIGNRGYLITYLMSRIFLPFWSTCRPSHGPFWLLQFTVYAWIF